MQINVRISAQWHTSKWSGRKCSYIYIYIYMIISNYYSHGLANSQKDFKMQALINNYPILFMSNYIFIFLIVLCIICVRKSNI